MPSSNLEISIDQYWQLITDRVMGGISNGSLTQTLYHDIPCLHLSGQVSTSNKGGFIQMGYDLTRLPDFEPERYTALRISVAGNSHDYNIHLKTRDLDWPWQSYRYHFMASPGWQSITVPLEHFQSHRTDKAFLKQNLIRLGLVAIGNDFDASLYLHQIDFLE